MQKLIRIVSPIMWVFVLLVPRVWAQERERAELLKREASVDIVGDGYGGFVAKADFGRLEAGENYEIRVILKNATSQVLRAPSIKTNCSCAKAELDRQVVPPNEKAILTAQIATPEKSRVENKQIVFNLTDSDSGTNIQLRLNYLLAGIVAFRTERFVSLYRHDSNGTSAQFRIPVLCTDAIYYVRELII